MSWQYADRPHPEEALVYLPMPYAGVALGLLLQSAPAPDSYWVSVFRNRVKSGECGPDYHDTVACAVRCLPWDGSVDATDFWRALCQCMYDTAMMTEGFIPPPFPEIPASLQELPALLREDSFSTPAYKAWFLRHIKKSDYIPGYSRPRRLLRR